MQYTYMQTLNEYEMFLKKKKENGWSQIITNDDVWKIHTRGKEGRGMKIVRECKQCKQGKKKRKLNI